MEHADFYGIGAYVIKYRAHLPRDEFHRHRVYAGHTDGVFVNHGDYGRGSEAAAG
jgi:hypothetical protein